VKSAFESHKIPVDSAELARVPTTTVELDVETCKRVFALIEALEENDDVQTVTSNENVSEEVLAAISG
jgi:transcriptional/translational regulatory protein YebC/TACO1